jgi:hypothetical protein
MINGLDVSKMSPVDAAAKLEGAPHSIVELTCRRLVEGRV